MNELEKQLDEYINQKIYNYAFMINGQWGSGKSYFIKKVYMKKYKDKEFIYLSLNGIENVEDIDTKLTEILIKEHLGKGNLKSINLKDVLRDLYKQLNYKNIVGILNKEYKKIIVESIIDVITDTLSKNNVVLIFDDFERCKVESEKLLAYINNFVEYQEIKTILVADESNIKNNKYKKTREKVIGNCVEYVPDMKNNIKGILSRINNEHIKNIINRNIENIDNELKEQKFINMRTVQFAIDRFINFYNIVLEDELCEKDVELENKIFNYIVYVSIRYKKSEELYKWEDSQYGYINIKEDYSYKSKKYGFKFIDDYIARGVINKEETFFIIQDYNSKNLPKDDPYEVLTRARFWELQDDEVYNLIQEMHNNLVNNKYSVNNISRILALLLDIKKFNYNIDIDEFIKLFKNLITEKQKDDEIYVFSTIEVNNMDEEVREDFIEKSKELKEYSIKTRFGHIENYISKCQFDKLLEDNFIINNRNIIVETGFFNNININKIVNAIRKEETVIKIWYLKYFCDQLIDNSQFKYIIEKDIQKINDLLKQLKKIDLREFGIGKANAIKYIIEDLEKMKDYKNLKKETKESSIFQK